MLLYYLDDTFIITADTGYQFYLDIGITSFPRSHILSRGEIVNCSVQLKELKEKNNGTILLMHVRPINYNICNNFLLR